MELTTLTLIFNPLCPTAGRRSLPKYCTAPIFGVFPPLLLKPIKLSLFVGAAFKA